MIRKIFIILIILFLNTSCVKEKKFVDSREVFYDASEVTEIELHFSNNPSDIKKVVLQREDYESCIQLIDSIREGNRVVGMGEACYFSIILSTKDQYSVVQFYTISSVSTDENKAYWLNVPEEAVQQCANTILYYVEKYNVDIHPECRKIYESYR